MENSTVASFDQTAKILGYPNSRSLLPGTSVREFISPAVLRIGRHRRVHLPTLQRLLQEAAGAQEKTIVSVDQD